MFLSDRSPGSSPEETEFQPEQGLEAVDLRNPRLVRVASVAAVEVSSSVAEPEPVGAGTFSSCRSRCKGPAPAPP